MAVISKQEEDKFANYSSRLAEIEEQLNNFLKRTILTDSEKDIVKSLISEKN
jgi:hypothetical protein